MTKTRCAWCGNDPLYKEYHDKEWGVPLYDDQQLFAMLILEGTQAGLSWLTILKKRQAYYDAFDQFNIEKVAAYSDNERKQLVENTGIVRNRLKIDAAIKNARGSLLIIEKYGSLSKYLWRYVDHCTLQNNWATTEDLPSQTNESVAMSRDLKKRGFNFVGPTICYAFMQSTGMVNDHTIDCFRHQKLKGG